MSVQHWFREYQNEFYMHNICKNYIIEVYLFKKILQFFLDQQIFKYVLIKNGL